MRKIGSIVGVAVLLWLCGPHARAKSASGLAARAVPNFDVKLLDGKNLTAKGLRGAITVIDFWGTWCKPCIMEIPDYNEFYKSYSRKGVRFIALAVESGTEEEVREAVRRLKIEYPVGALTSEEFDKYFNDLYVFPTTWVIDSEGNIQKEFLGVSASKHQALRDIVDNLLKSKPGA